MFNFARLQQTNQYAAGAPYWRNYLASDCQSEWAARARRSLKFCEMQPHGLGEDHSDALCCPNRQSRPSSLSLPSPESSLVDDVGRPACRFRQAGVPAAFQGLLAAPDAGPLSIAQAIGRCARLVGRQWLLALNQSSLTGHLASWLRAQPTVEKATSSTPDQWCHPEQPKLRQRPTAHEKRGTSTARGVHRSIGHWDAD
jgi:hypothetical protein